MKKLLALSLSGAVLVGTLPWLSANAVTPTLATLGNVKPVPLSQAVATLASRHSPSLAKVPNYATALAQKQKGPIDNISRTLGHPLPSLQASATVRDVRADAISSLALSLRYSPTLIYEYVHNNIEYEPLWGSNKGALGTFADQRGDDIDQDELMVALLQVSGYTQYAYCLGYIRLNGTTASASSWLGVPDDNLAIQAALSDGGIPNGNLLPAGSVGPLTQLDVAHVWLQVNLDNTPLPANSCTAPTLPADTYVFDPSFKQHTISPGINLASVFTNYNQATFLNHAGAATSPYAITNVSAANVNSDLNLLTGQLVSYLRANPTFTMNDVVGGKKINPILGLPSSAYLTTLPYLTPPGDQPAGGIATLGAAIPNSLRTYFTLLMPGRTAPADTMSFPTDVYYGQRITVFPTTTTAPYTAQLLAAGLPPSGGANTSTPAVSSGQWVMQAAIVHPFADPTLAAAANQSGPLSVNVGGYFLIGNGWGQTGRGMADLHKQLLAQANASGAAATSESVLGESLAVIGYSWLAQNGYQQRLTDQIIAGKETTQLLHGLGIVGHSFNAQSGVSGPYVDLPFNFQVTNPATSSTDTSPPAAVSANLTTSGTLSALESGVLNQSQAPSPNMTAASTVKLIATNAPSGTTYFADYTTAAGIAYYTNTIKPYVTANYAAGDAQEIDCWVTGGTFDRPTNTCLNPGVHPGQGLIPANPHITVGVWGGSGYSLLHQSNSAGVLSLQILQRITGGLSGGFAGVPIGPNSVVLNGLQTYTTDSGTNSLSGTVLTSQPSLGNPMNGEPIDAITGAELYDHQDVSVGSGQFPYKLDFTRTYNSANYLNDEGLGLGWTSEYGTTARPNSDPYQGMGDGSPIGAAAAITGLYVSQDLTKGARTAQIWTVASLVQNWWMERLTNNAAIVSQPHFSEEFMLLPDGTFNSPLGSAATLTSNGAVPPVYTYQTKDGQLLSFNTDGTLATWKYPKGVQVSLSYTGGVLSSVSNSLGNTLSLAHTSDGKHISSVTNGTATSGYSYTVSTGTELASAADPLGAVIRYTYDTSGLYDTQGHLTQVFNPSNPGTAMMTNYYDPVGRVVVQQDATANAWGFLMAGSRSEVIDPLGYSHVTYQPLHAMIVRDMYTLIPYTVLYGDTAQTNGVVNVTTNTYDGLDRLSGSVTPEGIATSYTYDVGYRYNLLTQVTTPKSGSKDLDGNLLQPITRNWTYDPTYNAVASSTDGNGNVTGYVYDTSTSGGSGNCAGGAPLQTGDLCQITYPPVTKPGVTGTHSPTKIFTYSTAGQVLNATDEEGRVTHFVYDSKGNNTAVTVDLAHLALASTYGYDGTGNITSIVDPRGNVSGGSPSSYTTRFEYDGKRRLKRIYTGPSSTPQTQSTITYDADDRPLTVFRLAANSATQQTNARYTVNGQLSSIVDALGNNLAYTYDQLRRVQSTANSAGRQMSYTYDPMSRVATITGGVATPGGLDSAITVNLGNVLLETRTYSPDGMLASTQDAKSNVTTLGYDGFDRLQKRIYPDTKSEGYEYDAVGNATKTLTRASAAFTWSYDSLNRMTGKFVPSNSSAPIANYCFGYDYSSRLLQTQQVSSSSPFQCGSAAPFQFGYDTAGRNTSEQATDGKVVAFVLDAAGNRTGLTWPDGFQVTYAYDMLNRMTDVYEGNGTGGLHLAHFDFDPLSNPTDLIYANGTAAYYGYALNSMLTSVRFTFASPPQVTFGYTYNTENALVARVVSDASYQTGPANPALAIGSQGYTSNVINQYTNVASAAYTYNDNGDLVNDGINTYGFDNDDRMVATSASGQNATYSYDPIGRRNQKTVGGTVTNYVSAGQQEIADYSGTGSVLYRYVYGSGVDEPLVRIDTTGNHSYLHADAAGSIVGVTDSTGTIVEKQVYTPFGVSDTHGPADIAFQFTGRRFDPESGLYYLRARYYSPMLGRFMSLDPLGRRPVAPRSFMEYAENSRGSDETSEFQGLPVSATLVDTMISLTTANPGEASVSLVQASASTNGSGPAIDQSPETGSQTSERTNLTAVWFGRGSPREVSQLLYGVNLYSYANMNPLGFSDPFGLSAVEQIAGNGPTDLVRIVICLLCIAPPSGLVDPQEVIEPVKQETVTPVPANPFTQKPPGR
ncbi:RHS repeat-associated core domain-containing protein [Paraburkholderia acidicola]|uniref:RHS repeat-associated core domain-containing protein n=1 Tax=Paraburkholderia acidicola TaxID=1912599 RepID=UPI0032DF409B